MNRDEFLERLFMMYPANFTPDNIRYWTEGYEDVLPLNIDFHKLYLIMLRNYDDTLKAPSPKWFSENAKNCKKETSNEALEHIKRIKEEGKQYTEIPAHVKERMANLAKKLSMAG